MSDSVKNSYLDQVMQEQQVLEQNMKARRAQAPAPAPQRAMLARQTALPEERGGSAVEVRVTGFWRWQTVVVPPNAYVVHTRKGHAEPLHIGLGVSFPYDPYRDAFLVVPGAMQTILINAKCICAERQGILVQGYVQWIIQDFATAYRKLDFSDAEEPMRIVNLQLREQAEAAIKDKVATMSIDDVLADKQPIIEELTTRLRSVAEGAGSDKGLGLRIVTVQIKEAVVSSARLWESLQKPFRAERARVARLAEIAADESIAGRELEAQRNRQTSTLVVERELSKQRAERDAEQFDREQGEARRRAKTEQENARALAEEQQATRLAALELDRARHDRETAFARLQLETQLDDEKTRYEAQLAGSLAQAEAAAQVQRLEAASALARQQVDNDLTQAGLQARLIQALPAVVEKLPRPDELKAVSIGPGTDGVASAVAQVLGVLDVLRAGGRTQG